MYLFDFKNLITGSLIVKISLRKFLTPELSQIRLDFFNILSRLVIASPLLHFYNDIPKMYLKIEFFGERFITVGAEEFWDAHMDHLVVLIQISFLWKIHRALFAREWSLARVSSQVIEVLTHWQDRESAGLSVIMLVQALKKFENSRLMIWSQEKVNPILCRRR